MSMYQRFCRETLDAQGNLQKLVLDYPDDFNFGYDVVDTIAQETPEKRAMVWCNAENEERVFTFDDIRTASNRMANVFRGAGLRRGMRVMLVLKRHYEYWFAVVALHKLGVTVIPATHMLTVSDYVYRLRMARVDAVVCTAQNRVPEKLRAAVEEAGSDCICWTVQQDVPGFRNLTAEMEAADETLPRQETAATDPILLYFTSGTTGYPKGVIHDFSYPLAHIVTAKYWQQAQEDGLHFTVAETGWAKASWGKLYGQWLVGVPDQLRGQAIKAVVVPAGSRTPDAQLEKEIKDFCNSRLAEYKWIRIVEFVKEMPKTISGKIRKSELRYAR